MCSWAWQLAMYRTRNKALAAKKMVQEVEGYLPYSPTTILPAGEPPISMSMNTFCVTLPGLAAVVLKKVLWAGHVLGRALSASAAGWLRKELFRSGAERHVARACSLAEHAWQLLLTDRWTCNVINADQAPVLKGSWLWTCHNTVVGAGVAMSHGTSHWMSQRRDPLLSRTRCARGWGAEGGVPTGEGLGGRAPWWRARARGGGRGKGRRRRRARGGEAAKMLRRGGGRGASAAPAPRPPPPPPLGRDWTPLMIVFQIGTTTPDR